MTTPTERAAATLDQWMKLSAEQMFALGARIATWLVIANGAALVISFQAITSGAVCDLSLFRQVVWAFVIGGGCAIFGTAANFFTGLFSTTFVLGPSLAAVSSTAAAEYYLAKLESEGVSPGDALLKMMEAAQSKATAATSRGPWIFLGLAIVVGFYLASLGFLGYGVLLPTSGQAAALGMCP